MKPYIQYIQQIRLYLTQTILRRLAATPVAKTITRSLNIDKPHWVNIGHPDRVVILLVGVGGTGSFAAHILAQLAVWAKGAGLDLRLVYIDPDHVEEKNLVRQNFCRAEVGYSKAFTLAWRYSNAFGLQITPVAARFSLELLYKYRPQYAPGGTLTIVVGAVDNHCARRDIAEALEQASKDPGRSKDKFWWIDSGNERVNGQIYAGNSLDAQPRLSPLGYCTGVPFPHIQDPGLLVAPLPAASGGGGAGENLSCAELTLLEEQSAMINRMMATWLGTYLYRLLQSRDLSLMASYINLRTGMVRSEPITGGRVVLPDSPQRSARPPRPPVQIRRIQMEEGYDPPDDPPACPNCGSPEIIEGRDEVYGELVDVVFCGHCDWRQLRCPACGEEVAEDEVELDGRMQPAYCCLSGDDCGWYAAQLEQPPEEGTEAETADVEEEVQEVPV